MAATATIVDITVQNADTIAMIVATTGAMSAAIRGMIIATTGARRGTTAIGDTSAATGSSSTADS